MTKRKCSVDGCTNRFIARGYCAIHYHVARRAGLLGDAPTLTLEQRINDALEDIGGKKGCWLWRGAINGDGYPITSIEGRQVMAHRAVYHLKADPGMPIRAGSQRDEALIHECGNKHCVNPKHLRFRSTPARLRKSASK